MPAAALHPAVPPPFDGVAPPAAPARPSRHIPALDGMRGLAALAVITLHFGGTGTGSIAADALRFVAQFGWTGVDLFFVLSGFLITGILLDSRDDPRYFRTFYRRRSLRIFPLYFLFVALYVLVVAPRLGVGADEIAARQGWLWTYLANIDIARQGWLPGAGSYANGLWSLAIEEQFYMMFPLAVLLLSRRGLAILAVAFVAASIAIRAALEEAGFPPLAGYVSTPSRLDGLGLGVLLAIVARGPHGLDRVVPIARVVLPVALAAVAYVAWSVDRFDPSRWRALLWGVPLVSAAYAALLVLAVAPTGSAMLRVAFESPVLRFFGRYSYGLYIWHPLVGGLLRRGGVTPDGFGDLLGSASLGALAVFVLKAAAATGVALVSFHLLEQPFLRLKDRRSKADRPARAVPAT